MLKLKSYYSDNKHILLQGLKQEYSYKGYSIFWLSPDHTSHDINNMFACCKMIAWHMFIPKKNFNNMVKDIDDGKLILVIHMNENIETSRPDKFLTYKDFNVYIFNTETEDIIKLEYEYGHEQELELHIVAKCDTVGKINFALATGDNKQLRNLLFNIFKPEMDINKFNECIDDELKVFQKVKRIFFSNVFRIDIDAKSNKSMNVINLPSMKEETIEASKNNYISIVIPIMVNDDEIHEYLFDKVIKCICNTIDNKNDTPLSKSIEYNRTKGLAILDEIKHQGFKMRVSTSSYNLL